MAASLMPYINLQITKGATREQKQAIVQDFTASLVSRLGKRPEHIHIVIEEIAEENWGFAGMLTDDFRRLGAVGTEGQPRMGTDGHG